MSTISQIRAELEATQQPLRRGYRTLPQHTWTGVVWSKEKGPGEEIADCGHRHFVGPEEAMQCPALDEYCSALAVDSLLAANAPTYLAALLDVAEMAGEFLAYARRLRAGDPTLDPEEWYIESESLENRLKALNELLPQGEPE